MDRQEPQNLTPEQRAYAQELSNEVEKLLLSNYPIEKIAELVGAEEFVKPVSRGKTIGKEFDVRSWIEHMARANQKLIMPKSAKYLNEILLPPDPSERRIGEGEGEYKEPRIIPRTRLLMEVLSAENTSYSIIEGENTDNMVRGRSYIAFLVPERKKVVFVNNEEGNATFIIHQIGDVQDWELYAAHTKQELKARPDVSVLHWPGDDDAWKQKVTSYLADGFMPSPVDSSSNDIESPEAAPEGWMTNHGIASSLNVSTTTVKRIADAYRAKHPDWFMSFRSQKGVTREYYHPDLIAIITEDLESRTVAPDGWKTNWSLGNELSFDAKSLRGIADEYRESNPEWFAMFVDNDGRKAEYYHPDLIARITSAIESRDIAPENWKTPYALSQDYGVPYSAIRNMADAYRSSHPEWFGQYAHVSGPMREHYHPDLVASIASSIEGRQGPPDGWGLVAPLSKELRIGAKTLRKLIQPYRSSHPEWIQEFVSSSGHKREYMHPNLIAKIKEQLGK